ncbi:MAG: MOFRL family protein, partial [Pseudomonadota bacterium]
GPSIAARLADPAAETPDADDPAFRGAHGDVFARPLESLNAASAVAQAAGYTPLILGDAIEGEARECARVMAGIALGAQAHGAPLPTPCALISGGETTVTVRGGGRGGRNAEWALGFAVAMAMLPGGYPKDILAIAGDTDGIDGVEDAAAAIVDETTPARAAAAGIDLAGRLADNDAYGAFAPLDDLVVTGPTLTNVNDFRAILVD